MRWPPSRAVVLGALAAIMTALVGVGVLPRWGGSPHLVALPPLDLFVDLRILVAAAPSYPLFLVGVAGSLTLRIAVLTLLLGGSSRHLRMAARFYAVALGPALIAALLAFSGQAGLYARLFWPGALVAGITLAVLAPAPWCSVPGLVRAVGDTLRQGVRVEVLGPYAAALLALGAVVDAAGPVVAVVAVPLSALLTGVALHRLVAPPPRRPLVALTAVVGVAAAATVAFQQSRAEGPEPAPREEPGALLLMSGINSSSGEGSIFEVDPSVFGYSCEQTYHYSYAGPGPGAPQGDSACPIVSGAPYVEQDTQRPLDELVEDLRLQLEERDAPLDVVAHSQAPWIAWAALAEHGDLGVDRLILLGAFPSSPLGYPPPGEPGSGRVGGDGLRLIAAVGQALGFEFQPDAPLAHEILAAPDASSTIFARGLPDQVRVLHVPAVVDLPLKPQGPELPAARTACPVRAAHPYLPAAAETHRAIQRFAADEPLADCPVWRDALAHAGRGLTIPPLHAPPAGVSGLPSAPDSE